MTQPNRRALFMSLSCFAGLALLACGTSVDAAQLLRDGSDESEIWDNRTQPEVPEGEQRLSASWFGDDETDALDINDEVLLRLESNGFEVSCEEPGQQPDTGAPLVECTFTGPDVAGTYTVQGGGPAPEDFNTDGIAIFLTSSIFAT